MNPLMSIITKYLETGRQEVQPQIQTQELFSGAYIFNATLTFVNN